MAILIQVSVARQSFHPRQPVYRHRRPGEGQLRVGTRKAWGLARGASARTYPEDIPTSPSRA